MEENLAKNKIYQEIKTGILNECYKAGEILNERKLAEEFNVSRTPIREALKLLEKEGWVRIIPWRGALVTEISSKEIEDILQVRLIIEPAIVELLQGKIDSQKKEVLAQLYELQKNATTKKEYMQADRKLHTTLVEWTENKEFATMIRLLNDKIYMVGQKAIDNGCFTADLNSLEEHKKIIEALKEENIPMAKYYMTIHIMETKERLLKNSKLMLSQE